MQADSSAAQQDQTPDANRLGPLRMAGVHGAVGLGLLALFAVADTWQVASGVPLATLFAVIAGLLAGAILTTLIHEWFHFLGVKLGRAHYHGVASAGLFAYDWDFNRNSVHQFKLMSVAGSVGSIAAVILFATMIPADNGGRIALQASAWGSLAFAAAIEWPVLRRVSQGVEPLTALSGITPGVLYRSALFALGTLLFAAYLLAD